MESNSELTTHLTTGAVVVYLLEWAKRHTGLGFISADSKSLNRFISATSAALIAAGINWTYDSTTGDLLIHGLTWSTILLTAWEWLKQFVAQQIIFDAVVSKKGGPTP